MTLFPYTTLFRSCSQKNESLIYWQKPLFYLWEVMDSKSRWVLLQTLKIWSLVWITTLFVWKVIGSKSVRKFFTDIKFWKAGLSSFFQNNFCCSQSWQPLITQKKKKQKEREKVSSRSLKKWRMKRVLGMYEENMLLLILLKIWIFVGTRELLTNVNF